METNEGLVNKELEFLVTLKDLAKQSLLNAKLKASNFPKDFDVYKAVRVLDRAMDAEIEFLHEEPDYYLDIYG